MVPLPKNNFEMLSRLPVVSLSLGHTRVRKVESLAMMTRLTELHLAREWMHQSHLTQLSALTGLEILSLRDLYGLSSHVVVVRSSWCLFACMPVPFHLQTVVAYVSAASYSS